MDRQSAWGWSYDPTVIKASSASFHIAAKPLAGDSSVTVVSVPKFLPIKAAMLAHAWSQRLNGNDTSPSRKVTESPLIW